MVEKVKKTSGERGPVTVYVDKELFRRFQKACEIQGISASRLTEEFMRELVESSEKVDEPVAPTWKAAEPTSPEVEGELLGTGPLNDAETAFLSTQLRAYRAGTQGQAKELVKPAKKPGKAG